MVSVLCVGKRPMAIGHVVVLNVRLNYRVEGRVCFCGELKEKGGDTYETYLYGLCGRKDTTQ